MDESPANLRSRELGHALRQAMVTREISGMRMSRLLGWSQPKVSRLLNGRRGTRATDVAAFLAHCLVLGEERDRLITIAEELDKEDWLQQYGSALPEQVHTYVHHEMLARRIYDFQAFAIPGLLQTESYARALITSGVNYPADEFDARLDARLARQQIFSAAERPGFVFYIQEHTLWLAAGDMREQLHHLLRMSVRDDISIRIVPTAAGVMRGMSARSSC